MKKMVGKIIEAHGIRGDLYVRFFANQANWLKDCKQLGIGSNTASPTAELELIKYRSHKEGFVISLAEIPDRTTAEKFMKHFIFVDDELIRSKPGEPIYLREILGFEVFDHGESLGSVVDVSSNGPQDLLVLNFNEVRFEIPFVKEFIVDIDFAQRRISMKLPPGLREAQS